MTEKQITFKNNKGNKLTGYYYKGKTKSLIISCHGLHSYNFFPDINKIFDFYHKLGFSVLRFDFSGYNKSEGKKSVVQRIDDINSAVKFLKKDYKEVIISAQSLCALPAVIAVTQNPSITKFIITNGLFNFNQINLIIKTQIKIRLLLNKSYREEKKFLEENIHVEKIKIPTLVVYADQDKVVNKKQSIDFFNALKTEKQLSVLHNSGHYPIKKENIEEGFLITKEWLRKYNLPG